MFKHILLATDGSPATQPAVQLAVSLARFHGAKLTAVYVVDPYPFLGIGETNPLGFQAYIAAAQEQAARAHAAVEALSRSDPPVDLDLRLVEDVAASEGIVRTAADVAADLVVVGSHGRGGISRLLLGSVAVKVVTHATVPVLVARSAAAGGR
jgi:nucleotide-binding universal stress UspA family protein